MGARKGTREGGSKEGSRSEGGGGKEGNEGGRSEEGSRSEGGPGREEPAWNPRCAAPPGRAANRPCALGGCGGVGGVRGGVYRHWRWSTRHRVDSPSRPRCALPCSGHRPAPRALWIPGPRPEARPPSPSLCGDLPRRAPFGHRPLRAARAAPTACGLCAGGNAAPAPAGCSMYVHLRRPRGGRTRARCEGARGATSSFLGLPGGDAAARHGRVSRAI